MLMIGSQLLKKYRKIVEYPDRRIKPIVYTMASSGIRLGAWNYLKWNHVTPIEKDGKVVAAKIRVYAEEEDEYFTFISLEAYNELFRWMNYRKECGEIIDNKVGLCVIFGMLRHLKEKELLLYQSN